MQYKKFFMKMYKLFLFFLFLYKNKAPKIMVNDVKQNTLSNAFGIFKYWINLNGQAKAVIALLTVVILFLGYRNHQLSQDVENQRIKYDKLQEQFIKEKDKTNVSNKNLYDQFDQKLEDYRTKRDKEVDQLLNDYKTKVERLENKIERYEKNSK